MSKGIAIQTGAGVGQALYDANVPDDYSTLTAALAGLSSGDSIFIRTQTTIENPTISNQQTVIGSGYSSQITGSLTISADNVTVQNLYIKGTITISSGVKNCLISDCYMDDPSTEFSDDSGNSTNVITNIIKVNV